VACGYSRLYEAAAGRRMADLYAMPEEAEAIESARENCGTVIEKRNRRRG